MPSNIYILVLMLENWYDLVFVYLF